MRQAFTFCAVLLLPFAFASAALSAPRPAALVTIISTGDRLTPGYRVTVSPDGAISSALVPRGQRRAIRRTDRIIAVNRQRFFADLDKAEPVASLPTGTITTPSGQQGGRRGRGRRGGQRTAIATSVGVNPYPEVFVRYHGHQSPNLRAASNASGQALYQDVKQILQVLRLPIPDVP